MNRRKESSSAEVHDDVQGEAPAPVVPPAPPLLPPSAPPSSQIVPPSGPPAEPTTRRLARHLPRLGLLLFLLAIVVIFRSVLLPFVLAAFFAYLIYPVVSRLERIPIGSRHPPRWLAVITVYALLFVIGWWTIPPLFGNFAEQVGKLLHDAPSISERVLAKRKSIGEAFGRWFEVQSLSEPARFDLFSDVDALAEGRVVPFVPPEGLELPPPPPPEPEPKPEATAPVQPPTVIQFLGINVNLGPNGPGVTATTPSSEPPVAAPHEEPPARPSDSGTPPTAPAGEASAPATDVTPSDESAATVSQTPEVRRFDKAKADELKFALRDAINGELEKPGPARDLPARVEREFVPALVKEHVGLPPDDAQVQVFARNSGARVAIATRRESYGDLVNAYFESAVRSTRTWLQDELKELASLATGWTVGLVGGIFDFFMVLMLTAFYLVYFPRVRDYVRDLVAPQYREDYGKVLKRIDMRLSGAIRGQVIICIVNATLTFPGLWFIGTHTDATNLAAYAVLLSVLAGVLSMIPIFGVILSTVPMVILALAQGSMGGATLVVGWICVIHAIEAYLLNPNILGHSASMNPIIVVFALLAGKQVYGLVGALLAVPVASVLVSLFGYYRRLVAARVAQEEGVTVPVDTWGD